MTNEPIFLIILGGASTGSVMLCLRWRAPPGFARMMLLCAMAALTVDTLCTGFSGLTHTTSEVMGWQRFGMLARAISLVSLTLFSLTYARVNYREFLHSWRWPMTITTAALLVLTVFGWNDLLTEAHLEDNHSSWRLDLGRSGSFIYSIQLILSAIALMNMERTLRAAVGTLRWKVKFITLGVGIILCAYIYTTTQALIIGAIEPILTIINWAAIVVGCALVTISLLRTHLGTGDLFISTHLIFRSLTVLVIGGYLVLVGITSSIFFTCDPCHLLPLKILIFLLTLAALGIILLSDRVRQKAKMLLSRHLLRPQYDHRQIWATLIGKTSQSADATSFCRETANWFSETFDLLSVTIWIIDEPLSKLSFGGSTRTAPPQAPHSSEMDIKTLIQSLRTCGDLIDLETTSGDWATLIKQLSPDTFNLGGPRICLPLLAGQDVVGMMVMTDRVQRVALSPEELDLFRTIATHIAARLYVYRLSEQVLLAKQMEAFQAMSAFFVHDLKNTASTLSLMLRNLPRHFDDPAFRDDGLRAVSKSVDRINTMIAKLALFRQGMSISPSPTNLNSLVSATLAECNVPEGIEVHRELRPIPSIPLDPSQIKKVLQNLIINACEAMPQGGKIIIETEFRDPFVLLVVSDNGNGMSADFMCESLFRPFKTSKPQGLGIGLFHAKVIVESHGGRIEVQSEPNKGSHFKVWFPLKGGPHESPTVNRG